VNTSFQKLLFRYFLVCPIWLPVFFIFFNNEQDMCSGINPGTALVKTTNLFLNLFFFQIINSQFKSRNTAMEKTGANL